MEDGLKISELTQASTINDSDLIPIVQSDETKSITKEDLIADTKALIDRNSTYSTTEQIVGTWIDGKPIYRVVKNIGNLPNNGRKEVSFSGIIPTGVVCTKIYGITERISQSVTDYLNLKDVCSLLMYRATTNILYVDTSEDRSNYTGYVVLEYTKTTD